MRRRCVYESAQARLWKPVFILVLPRFDCKPSYSSLITHTCDSSEYHPSPHLNYYVLTIRKDAMALAGELIDLIIDHLHDDRPALKICSLLCKSWLSESRFHLFRKVILAYNNYEDFLDLLKSPLCTIGPHVRCLVVHFDAMPSIPSLTALPNVVSLRLHDLPQMFPDQAAVEALSGFRSVRRLTIGIWRITPLKYLIEVVSKFPTLEAFATDSFESNIATHDPGNVPVWPWAPCHLRSLCLSQCARKHILRALIDAGVRISELTLHNLADFDDDGEFGVDEEEMDTVSLFLKGQGSELKEFKWTSQYHILDAATSHSPGASHLY